MSVDAFRWNEAALHDLLEGPDGPVAELLGQKAIRVQNDAKLNATGRAVAGANNPQGRGPRVDTGRLRGSISWQIGQDGVGLFADVGTNVPYGYWLETGLRDGRTYPFLRPALAAV